MRSYRWLAGCWLGMVLLACSCGGEPASVTGTVTFNDGAGDVSGVAVDIGHQRTSPSADGDFEVTDVEPGERTLRADGNGYQAHQETLTLAAGEDRDVGTIELKRDNEAPVVENLQAMPAEVEPGGTAMVTVTASDPEGDALSYTWEAPTSGWSIAAGGGPTEADLTAPDAHGETGMVRIVVEDDFGGQTTNDLLVSTTAE